MLFMSSFSLAQALLRLFDVEHLMNLAKFFSSLGWGVLLWNRHRCLCGLGSGDGYNGGDGVGEGRRHHHCKSSSLAPGIGLLRCPAHLAREGKEVAWSV